MGIYIKGMEMPTRCGRCDMCITEADGNIDAHKECCITGAIIDNLGEKMEDCPLVEIPPHGRLIDADALEAYVRRLCTMAFGEGNGPYYFAYKSLAKLVSKAPTIIEAEEETR